MGRYVEIATSATVTVAEVRTLFPHVSIPDGADLADLGYARLVETEAPAAGAGFKVVAGQPTPSEGEWRTTWDVVPLTAEDIAARAGARWGQIKVERDRRAAMGVKAGGHWFHSDQKSRTQQLGLVLLGQGIPAGLQWKTLAYTPQPVFVAMTPALAVAIVQATAASDTAIFTAAEVHRMAMEASPEPGSYDFTGGWPPSFEDEAHEAGFAVDASVF